MTIRMFASATALLLSASTAFAAPAAKTHAAKKAAKPAALVCPITGETIASVKDAAGQSVYKGKTYYFCCASCKPEFDKNPQAHVK